MNKSIYGLKQASRQWFTKFSTALVNFGFHQSKNDYSLFLKGSGDQFVIVLVYVDDIILAGPNVEVLNEFKLKLQSTFKLKDLGNLKYFLGLEIARSSTGISLNQRKYILSLLEDTGFLGSKPSLFPMDPNSKLSIEDGTPLADVTLYRRLIGRLSYLTITRLDIAFTVNKLSQFVSQPKDTHLHAVHTLLRYLKGSPGKGLFFPSTSNLLLTAYSDADWGTCVDSRKSTSGYCMYLGDALISWKSKKQNTVARSFAEAEYRAMASAVSEVIWLKNLLLDFQLAVPSVKLLCDSQAAMHIASNPIFHERTKHIDIDCHFVRQHVQSGMLKLIHVKSAHQLANILTKSLPSPQFHALIAKLGLIDIYLPT